MTPIEWALRPFKRYADFAGRSPRAEYWWYVLAVVVVGASLGFIDGLVLGGPLYGGLGPLGLAFTATTVVPGMALLVRRLHDTETSGWLALIRLPTYVVIGTGSTYRGAAAAVGRTSGVLFAVESVAFILWACAALFVFLSMFKKGDDGPNRYGPNPYGPDQLEEVFA